MPVNRVHDAKIKLYWHQLLKEREVDPSSPSSPSSLSPSSSLPPFIPGLLLFPIPKAGRILGYIDVAFWAETSYIIGSIVYLIDSFYLWRLFQLQDHDDGHTPGAIFNLVATVIFIFNGIACFLDWWLQYKQLSVLSLDIKEEAESKPVYLPSFSSKASIYYG